MTELPSPITAGQEGGICCSWSHGSGRTSVDGQWWPGGQGMPDRGSCMVWRGPTPGELRSWGSSSFREGQGKGCRVAEPTLERPGAMWVGSHEPGPPFHTPRPHPTPLHAPCRHASTYRATHPQVFSYFKLGTLGCDLYSIAIPYFWILGRRLGRNQSRLVHIKNHNVFVFQINRKIPPTCLLL